MAPLTPIGIYVPPQPGYTYVVPVTLPSSIPYQEPPPSSTYRETPAPQPTILTTARKIIITSLPHHTHRTALLSLLANCDPHHRITVQSVEVAKHPDGRAKGHAFAVLENHIVAKRVVERINGLKWQGRTLCARLAKEGVEEREERRTPQLRSPLLDWSRKAYPASSYASSSQRANSEASSQPSEGRGVDRERGPSRRDKEEEREPGTEKKKNSPPSPAVVDGSHSGTARERRRGKEREK
jgi:hypothetical protein